MVPSLVITAGNRLWRASDAHLFEIVVFDFDVWHWFAD